jgi:hypothetical protein
MAKMSDHDRIEEIHAYLGGMLLVIEALLSAVEAVAKSDPELREALSPLIAKARFALECGEQRGKETRRLGEERWDARPEWMRQSPGKDV